MEYNDVTLRFDVGVDEVLQSNPYMLIYERAEQNNGLMSPPTARPPRSAPNSAA